jgi:hypothetical protein
LIRGLRIWYAAMPRIVNVISGPTTPRKIRIGSSPMTEPQSGITNSAVVSRIWFQMSSIVSISTSAS